jgi:hypothetical protein
MDTTRRRGRAVPFAQAGETAMLCCQLGNRLWNPPGQQHRGGCPQTYDGYGEQGKRNALHLQLRMIESVDRSIICCVAANINISYVVYQLAMLFDSNIKVPWRPPDGADTSKYRVARAVSMCSLLRCKRTLPLTGASVLTRKTRAMRASPCANRAIYPNHGLSTAPRLTILRGLLQQITHSGGHLVSGTAFSATPRLQFRYQEGDTS